MDEYLYKIGDIVRIRPDISCSESYRMRSGPKNGKDPGTAMGMENYSGQVHAITGYDYGFYQIDNDPENFCWSDDMFEPVRISDGKIEDLRKKMKYKPGDTITIRSDLKPDWDYPVLSGPKYGSTVYCNEDMVFMGGKTYEIKSCNDGVYHLKNAAWSWTDSMFEETDEYYCSSLL